MPDQHDGEPAAKPEQPRPLWQLSRDEQRMLLITFVGGVASIIAGAAIIGLALAYARFQHHHHPFWHNLLILGACALASTVLLMLKKWASLDQRQQIALVGLAAMLWSFLILWLVGLAAGIQ